MFLDFEGTQFSHEMIALGAVLATLGKDGRIKKSKDAIKIYVKSKNKIGNYVKELTGITQLDLDNKGVSFATAMEQLKKYAGLNFKKCKFCTFGNHDMRILGQSISYNLDFPKDICSQIQHNYFDFLDFISEFIKDDKGNPYSLVRYCELFGVPLSGEAHDPRYDAINLMNLYDAFLQNRDVVIDKYKFTLQQIGKIPVPVKRVIQQLNNGENVTPEQFETFIKDYIS